jgi:nitroreductase
MTDKTLETIGKLRTIHWDFNGKEVSDDDLKKIIKHGMRAAHSTNLATYSVIAVDNEEFIKKLVANKGPARCCVYCIDYTRTIDAMKLLGHDYIPPSSWYHMFADLYDVYAFAQTSVIAAKSMGIDSLITNGIFRVNMGEARKLLNLPEKHCFPVIAVLFGYSDKPENETTGRISIDQVLHFNKYNAADEDGLRNFISDMDKIYPEYIDGKYATVLDWYYGEWLRNGTGQPGGGDIQLRNELSLSGYVF